MQDSSDVKGPGLLLYTKDMPAVVLSNVSTRLGIVNGALGKATGVVADPAGMFPTLLISCETMLLIAQFYPMDCKGAAVSKP